MDGYTRIPILEAAALCGLQMKPSTLDDIEVQARCPFCDDKSHHLYLNTEEDLCYCQRCGTGGNSITLYTKITGVDNKTAYRQLVGKVESTIRAAIRLKASPDSTCGTGRGPLPATAGISSLSTIRMATSRGCRSFPTGPNAV